jgi:NADPH:quinone reductase-like Zn-dependent oxidoreductase
VGRALVELGRRAGLEVFGTASRAKDEAAALGAIPIDYQSEDFVRVVRGAGGVDAAFDAIGGPHFLGSYRTLRRGGTLVGFGVSSAWSGGKANGPRAGLSLLGLLGSNLFPDRRHTRFYTASRAIKHRETYREDLGKVLELLARGEIHPKIGAVLPLSQANHAHELVEQGRVSGKVVLTPDTTNQQ